MSENDEHGALDQPERDSPTAPADSGAPGAVDHDEFEGRSRSDSFSALSNRWRRSSRQAWSLTTVITIVVLTIFIVCGAAVAVLVPWQARNKQLAEAKNSAKSYARAVASLYADARQQKGHLDVQGVNVLLDYQFRMTGTGRKDSMPALPAWVVIEGDRGIEVGKLRSDLVNFPPQLKTDSEIRDWFIANRADITERFVRGSYRLRWENDPRVYLIDVGYSVHGAYSQFFSSLLLAGGIGLVAAVFISLGLVFYLRRQVLDPVRSLGEAMRDVRRGLFDTRVAVTRNDELGALAETFNFMTVGLEEREHLEDAFQRYVSKQVLDKILATGASPQLRGETRRVTVLFSDIRGFTTMSERMQPEEVVGSLNAYFTEMVEVVFRHDGFLNKFVGDAMMAVWGAPFDHDQPELRAVRCGVEMLEALSALNNLRQQRDEQPLAIGIGISTGYAVSGNIGHVERMEYTVIGDAVNVAQRIESQTKKLNRALLIEEQTYQAIRSQVEAEALPTMLVKGKEAPLKLFAISGLKGEQRSLGATLDQFLDSSSGEVPMQDDRFTDVDTLIEQYEEVKTLRRK